MDFTFANEGARAPMTMANSERVARSFDDCRLMESENPLRNAVSGSEVEAEKGRDREGKNEKNWKIVVCGRVFLIRYAYRLPPASSPITATTVRVQQFCGFAYRTK